MLRREHSRLEPPILRIKSILRTSGLPPVSRTICLAHSALGAGVPWQCASAYASWISYGVQHLQEDQTIGLLQRILGNGAKAFIDRHCGKGLAAAMFAQLRRLEPGREGGAFHPGRQRGIAARTQAHGDAGGGAVQTRWRRFRCFLLHRLVWAATAGGAKLPSWPAAGQDNNPLNALVICIISIFQLSYEI